MTLLWIGMFVGFGFLAVRHFVNRRFAWGAIASIGALLGAGSLVVDALRATQGGAEEQAYASPGAKNAWSKEG